ncbi:hypothetical protein BHE74_00001665 [Ensete ventricosum]|nr:hypothetical protein GW17_00017619 [Ensete ventricosum]RWW89390.1 hypothetical protein BHE74_00001665 [Ensete ventricosum]
MEAIGSDLKKRAVTQICWLAAESSRSVCGAGDRRCQGCRIVGGAEDRDGSHADFAGDLIQREEEGRLGRSSHNGRRIDPWVFVVAQRGCPRAAGSERFGAGGSVVTKAVQLTAGCCWVVTVYFDRRRSISDGINRRRKKKREKKRENLESDATLLISIRRPRAISSPCVGRRNKATLEDRIVRQRRSHLLHQSRLQIRRLGFLRQPRRRGGRLDGDRAAAAPRLLSSRVRSPAMVVLALVGGNQQRRVLCASLDLRDNQ